MDTKKFNTFIGSKKIKVIIINIVNVILFFSLVFILNKLPQTAREVKKARSESIVVQEVSEIAVLSSEIEKNKGNIEKIDAVFATENGFLEFISSVEAIQADGILSDFVFPVSQPIPDSTGNIGFPVSLIFRGNQTDVNREVERFLLLPFLTKTLNANIELSPGSEDIILRMGVFLYINEEFKS